PTCWKVSTAFTKLHVVAGNTANHQNLTGNSTTPKETTSFKAHIFFSYPSTGERQSSLIHITSIIIEKIFTHIGTTI
ncbi:unnamed protein product, partial [Brassica oleracea var. botrytis]